MTFVVLAFVYMKPTLTVRLNYGSIMADNSMGFIGIRPAPNIRIFRANLCYHILAREKPSRQKKDMATKAAEKN